MKTKKNKPALKAMTETELEAAAGGDYGFYADTSSGGSGYFDVGFAWGGYSIGVSSAAPNIAYIVRPSGQ